MVELVLKVIASLVGTGGAVTVLVQWFIKRKQTLAIQKHVNGLRDLSSIYRSLNQIVGAGPVCRSMVNRSRNNGGIPGPGCSIKVGVMYEVFNESGDSVRGKWDEREADANCSDVLVAIAESPLVLLETAKLPENSALRALYESSGVLRSSIYRLWMGPTEMLYLSINFTPLEETTNAQKVVIAQAVDDLRRIFARHKGTLEISPSNPVTLPREDV